MSVNPEDFRKEWRDKIVRGGEFRDSDLRAISTSSAKLDWALKLPFLEGSIVEIFGHNQTGKAQPLDAKVLTPRGFVKMGDIRAGDYVSTPCGGTGRVLKVFPQGKKEIYRVVFDDGSSTECCIEHLWYTKTHQDRVNGKPGSIKSLNEIRKTLKLNNSKRTNNHSIPSTNVFLINSVDLNIDPYLLGLLLGDGYLPNKGCVKITSKDEEIVSYASSAHKNSELVKVADNNYDYRFTGKNSTLKQELRKLNLLGKRSWEKFIPESYKIAKHEDRISIIQGIFDTDGYVEKNGSIEFSTTSKRLLEDVMFIVRSLGGKCSFKERMGSYRNGEAVIETRTNYRLRVRFANGIIPFRLTRKVDRLNDNYMHTDRFIKDIQYIGEKEAQCIYIDTDEHLYITDDFIQTHNTTLALEVCSNAMKMGKQTFYLDLERKLREAQLNMIDGFDKENFTLVYPDTGEETINMMHELILAHPGCVIVTDSVGALLPEVEDAQGAENQTMGLVARLTAKLIRKVTGIAARNKCTLIFINHLTATMAMFGKKETVKGGKSIQDRAAQRIEMVATSANRMKNSDGDVIGQMVRCTVIKNNVNRPYISVEVPIIFGKGIASSLDTLQFARDLGILPYQKGWYTVAFGDEEPKRMREAQVLELITSNEDFKNSVKEGIDSLFA